MLACMLQRLATLTVTATLLSALVVVTAPSAAALCAADPTKLSFSEMITKDKTGQRPYDTLVFGKVVAIKDLEPGRGGDKLAKLAVAEVPVGHARFFVRVAFYKPPPQGPYIEDNLVYRQHAFYGVLAKRQKDGTWVDDAGCGQTRQLARKHFWTLVRFARNH